MNAITFGSLIAFVDSFVHQTRLALTLLELFGFLGIGGALLLREFSLPAPLLPVDLLRIPMFGLSVATSICSFLSQTMALIALPFWLQRIGVLCRRYRLSDRALAHRRIAVVAPISGPLVGSLSGRASRAFGLASLRGRIDGAGFDPAACEPARYRLAHGDCGRRLRPVSDAQQPDHAGERAAREQRRGGRACRAWRG